MAHILKCLLAGFALTACAMMLMPLAHAQASSAADPQQAKIDEAIIFLRAEDQDSALALLTAACDAGSAKACEKQGLLQIDIFDFDGARVTLQKACAQNMARSCYLAATSVESNMPEGEEENSPAIAERTKAGHALFMKSCDLKYLPGCYTAAWRMRDTESPVYDRAAALALMDSSCTGGIREACNEAVSLLQYTADGNFVEDVDIRRLSRLQLKGCDLGDSSACSELAYRLKGGDLGKPDHARAVALYEKACMINGSSNCEPAIRATLMLP